MKMLKMWAASAAMLAVTGLAHAELFDRGNGTVYDSTQNITWLQDWNLNGQQEWAPQMAWAENLTFAGGSMWSLPTIDQYIALFGEFGDLTAVEKFKNMRGWEYWTSMVSNTDAGIAYVYNFNTIGGYQRVFGEGAVLFAVAVHPGDVAAVPEPESYLLMLTGLGAIIPMIRRSRAATA